MISSLFLRKDYRCQDCNPRVCPDKASPCSIHADCVLMPQRARNSGTMILGKNIGPGDSITVVVPVTITRLSGSAEPRKPRTSVRGGSGPSIFDGIPSS